MVGVFRGNKVIRYFRIQDKDIKNGRVAEEKSHGGSINASYACRGYSGVPLSWPAAEPLSWPAAEVLTASRSGSAPAPTPTCNMAFSTNT